MQLWMHGKTLESIEYEGRFAEGHSVFNLKLNTVIRIAQTEADETL